MQMLVGRYHNHKADFLGISIQAQITYLQLPVKSHNRQTRALKHAHRMNELPT